MRFLCWFTSCRWIPIWGHVWQCSRCKTLSIGRDVVGYAEEIIERDLGRPLNELEAKQVRDWWSERAMRDLAAQP